MGKEWDATGVAFRADAWCECLRVLKPGGYLLAFGGSRTYHRMAVAIEDAGFEIRDSLMWLYSQGFPKSHNLKGDWEGWGTALKPAHEPIVMARKPFPGTVAANVAAHGTGALNIEGCRVPTPESWHDSGVLCGGNSVTDYGDGLNNAGRSESHPAGRWPANVVHDGSAEVLEAFPDAPGQIADISATAPSPKTQGIYGPMRREGELSQERRYTAKGGTDFAMKPGVRRLDTGSAARFFYCAKADGGERNYGLDVFPAKAGRPLGISQWEGQTNGSGKRMGADAPMRNHHPTVKPVSLMRWLCRLVTPPGGTVLDPFTGSGTTGVAAVLEGFAFIGIEREAEYRAIAERRIVQAAPTLPGLWDEEETPADA